MGKGVYKRKSKYTPEEKRASINKASKEWRERNLEHVSKYRSAYSKRYFSKQENIDKRKDRLLFKQYGITLPEYQKMLIDQDYKCKICMQDFGTTQINVDHSHDTGKVRGLLCSPCNISLGHLKDDISRIQSLLNYLKESI
jgi:hypothetical protein